MFAIFGNSYKLIVPLAEINNQVNEQANAGLEDQLAYMTADNFMFTVSLFLCLKNMDKKKKINISTLSM